MEQYVLGVDEENCGRGLLKQSPNYAKLLSTTGSAGSLYLTQFWNHDQNLTYFYNGDYPLESKGRGATADQILLKDGDFVDVAMYTDWSFWSEKMSGFLFFSADGKTPQKTFTVEKNADLKLTYLRARANMNGDPAGILRHSGYDGLLCEVDEQRHHPPQLQMKLTARLR